MSNIRNAALNITDEGLWGFQASLVAPSTVPVMLLKGLGASAAMIGCIAAIDGGLIVAPQILGNYIFHSRRRRKQHLMIWHFIVMLPLLGTMALLSSPLLPLAPESRRWALLGCFACFQLTMGVVTAAWFDWVAHVFDVRIRGTVMGLSWTAAALLGSAASLVAGSAITANAGLNTYCWLYIVAGAIAYVSILSFWFIHDPAAGDAPLSSPPSAKLLLHHFAQSLRERNFRSFLIGRMLATSGFCIGPFIAIYYTSTGGGNLGGGSVVSHSAAGTVGMALAGLTLGRLGDRCGHRVGILIGGAVQVATLSVLLLSSGSLSCSAVYFGVGVCVGVNLVSHFNMLFETCRHDNRMAHITVGNLLLSIAAIGAPLLASAAVGVWGLRTLFALCLLLSLASFVWFLFRVKDPRDEMPLEKAA